MSSLPIFISTVANSSDEPCFPLLFTWSTVDAQIKEVLVIPDDEWLDEAIIDPNTLDLNEQKLYEFGYEASDILAEWINEFDTDVVYAFDVDLVASMIEKTFDTKGLDASFEVASIYDWFQDHGVDLSSELALLDQAIPAHLQAPDELIAHTLKVAYDAQLIDLPEQVND